MAPRSGNRPAPAPSAVSGPAFRVSEALAAGHTSWSTSPRRMPTPTRSVRTLTPLESTRDRAAAFALALPEDVAFSHTTAARLWGLPLPRVLAEDRGLHVSRRTGRSRITRRGCLSHKGLERREVSSLGGLRVTSPADTWLDLVELWHARLTLDDAVMTGDAVVELLHPTKFVHDEHPQADPSSTLWWRDPATSGCQDLLVRFLDRETFRGRRLARAALRLIRPRVWSPMESYARVAMVSAHLPEPRLNLAIESEHGPRRLAIGDFVWRHRAYRHKVVGEYNGPTHERQLSREHDHTRRLDLEDEGWRVVEIYSRDVFEPQRRHRLIQRLAGWLGV
jgi:hypothetical protein